VFPLVGFKTFFRFERNLERTQTLHKGRVKTLCKGFPLKLCGARRALHRTTGVRLPFMPPPSPISASRHADALSPRPLPAFCAPSPVHSELEMPVRSAAHQAARRDSDLSLAHRLRDGHVIHRHHATAVSATRRCKYGMASQPKNALFFSTDGRSQSPLLFCLGRQLFTRAVRPEETALSSLPPAGMGLAGTPLPGRSGTAQPRSAAGKKIDSVLTPKNEILFKQN